MYRDGIEVKRKDETFETCKTTRALGNEDWFKAAITIARHFDDDLTLFGDHGFRDSAFALVKLALGLSVTSAHPKW
jgi:hypothetical protein